MKINSQLLAMCRRLARFSVLSLVAFTGTVVSAYGAQQTMVIGAPNSAAVPCTETDFGAIQIRIGRHATLRACYRDVAIEQSYGTAFVTVPREFEDRIVSVAQFDRLRADVMASENGQRENKRSGETAQQAAGLHERTALGVFDNSPGRIAYAYAYGVPEVLPNGHTELQTMMRTEAFVLVNGRVILLMLVTPIDDGNMAATAFDISENWAKAIIKNNPIGPQASIGK